MPTTHTSSRATTVIATGLIAGTADALGAIVHFVATGGTEPARIFRYIASAVFGPAALTGGTPMVLCGLLFHFVIAMGWTVVYFVAATRWTLLRENVLASAALYGVFVWTMMTRVIIPFTRITPRPFNPTQAAVAALVLVICIGLPNAISAKRFFTSTRHAPATAN